MRIIAGRFKGRTLRGPKGPGLRPTSDRLRETLFNVLRERVEGARVLDGYAGTGAVGLEAISRGAVHTTFIESDRRALVVLRWNIDACGATPACTIVSRDFLRAMARPDDAGAFEIVFLDPPYDIADFAPPLIEAGRAVSPSGLVVLEHAKRRQAPEQVSGLVRQRLLEAGDSALSFYVPAAAG